ncbi:hypothetical protein [Frankia tisae]|uniref:phosphatase domain-containing protein n=1 Tax=Frankia tisae TaxID=2950104 RepID=UPI0021BE06EC|nr:hypothetical protein [Frankia tisae]
MTDAADAAGIAGTVDSADGTAGSSPLGGPPGPTPSSAGGRGDPIVPEQRPLAVIDVDGVVADVRHRLRFLRAWPGDWEAFFAAAPADPPLAEGVTLVHQLARDHEVVWLTGRPERSRAATSRWLGEQGLPLGKLLMRPDDDRRPARMFKRAELRQLGARRQVAVVVDDDPAVVDLLRADGWPVLRAEWLAYEATLGNAQESEGRT